MVLRLDSGMINGVRMWPLKKPFRLYLILPVQRMPPLQLDHFEFFGGSNKWNVRLMIRGGCLCFAFQFVVRS